MKQRFISTCKPTTTSAHQPERGHAVQVKAAVQMSVFDALPESAFVRQSELIKSPQKPTALAPLPFSASTLWRKVNAGTFPKPTKLSEGVTAWNVGVVRTWMAAQAVA